METPKDTQHEVDAAISRATPSGKDTSVVSNYVFSPFIMDKVMRTAEQSKPSNSTIDGVFKNSLKKKGAKKAPVFKGITVDLDSMSPQTIQRRELLDSKVDKLNK